MRTALGLSLILLAAIPARGALHAQSSGAAFTRALVLPAITVTGTRDLDFGLVVPTQTRIVAAKNGGTFSIQGVALTPVVIQFTQLPPSLGTGLSVGSWTGLRNIVPGSGSATAFTPVPGGSMPAVLSPQGRYFLWFGATLTTTNALPGNYSVPVVVTVVYN